MKLAEALPNLGPVIPFSPQLARWLHDKETKTNGRKAAIFLSQLIYWTGKEANPDGWIYKTIEDFEDETTLSRTDQDKAIKKLTELGVLEVGRKKTHGIRHFRINQKVLTQKWREYLSSQNEQASPSATATSAKSCLQKSDKDDCEKSVETIAKNSQTHLNTSIYIRLSRQEIIYSPECGNN